MNKKGIVVLLFISFHLIATGQSLTGTERLPNNRYFTVREGLNNFYKAISVRKKAQLLLLAVPSLLIQAGEKRSVIIL